MFRAKRIDTGEIQTVLSVTFDDLLTQTHFFVWDKNGWRWRPAKMYVPPNVDPVEVGLIKTTNIANDGPPF